MTAQPKVQARPRKWLTPVALVLLKEENSYGYELMERIEEDFGFEQISPGSVYRTLRLSLRFNPNGRLAVWQPRIPRMEAPDRR